MFFYILVFVGCMIIGSTLKSNRGIKLMFLIIWSVYAFRNIVGIDDEGYASMFTWVRQGNSQNMEWTFVLISKIVQWAGLNYKGVFFVYATLSFLLLYKAVELMFNGQQAKVIYMASFLGLCFVSTLTVMRQFLAASFCIYALALQCKSNKIVKPIILYSLAAMFHYGAVLAFLLLWLVQKKVKVNYQCKLAVLTFCIICGYVNISQKLLAIIAWGLPRNFQYYIENNLTNGNYSTAIGTVSLLEVLLFVAQCLVCMHRTNEDYENPINLALENGQWLYLCVLLFFRNAGVASRLAFTFLPCIATLPVTFIHRLKFTPKWVVPVVITGGMFILYLMSIYSTATIYDGIFIPYNASFSFYE